ncbi:MAG: S-layer homology domain-containing protein [Eubacteriales bacterium]|jgi:hypothetical protein
MLTLLFLFFPNILVHLWCSILFTPPRTNVSTVTNLWKLAGSLAAKPTSFADVAVGADYTRAVAWAVQQGITKVASATAFSPNSTCTREQIVTFLYRDMAK